MRYLVQYDTPGQMCNRFWSYIDQVGYAIETKSKILVLFWDESLKEFDNLRRNPFLKFPLYSNILIKLFGEKRYLNYLKILCTNRYSRWIYRHILKKYVKAIKGYDYHNDHLYYPKYLPEIRELFQPNENIRLPIDSYFMKLKKEGFSIIGIHIRRGDYKNWRGGKYFYSLDDYSDFMSQIERCLNTEKIIFYISTNERQEKLNHLAHHRLCERRGSSAAMDLYALSKCDYIIGPPSTFSRWASLMGSVPIYLIWDKTANITRKAFSPLLYLDEREDGIKYQ